MSRSKYEFSKKDGKEIALAAVERAGSAVHRVNYDWLVEELRFRDYYNPAHKVQNVIRYLRDENYTGIVALLAENLASELRDHREARTRLRDALRYVMPEPEPEED